MPYDEQSEQYLADSIAQVGAYFGQASLDKDNRHWAENQADKQYERSIIDWNRTNAYNSPAQQMQRMIEAGLNPNLIYGNMNNAPATNSINYQPARHEKKGYLPDTDKALKSAQFGQNVKMNEEQIRMNRIRFEQEVRMNDAQIQKMELENHNIQQDTVNKSKDSELKVLTAIAKAFDIKVNYGEGGLMEQDRLYKIEAINELKARIKKVNEEKGEAEARKIWLQAKNQIYQDTGINIEHDPAWMRLIGKYFKLPTGDQIKGAFGAPAIPSPYSSDEN